jgi:hypothetical protein
MQVFVPFAGPSWPIHAVRIALQQDGIYAQFVPMVNDFSYFELVSGLWEKQEDFIIVEHDIIVWPGAIQKLTNCKHMWCTYPYYCSVGWILEGLGCTKFSKKMMKKYPDYFKEPFPTCCKHDKNYCGLDRFIAHRGIELDIKPHVHNPGITNLNEKWT